MTTNYKELQHGNWKFQYNLQKNIFSTDLESYDNCCFNQTYTNTLLPEDVLEDFRKASLIHKVARKKALTLLYTGSRLSDLVDAVETIILKLCKQSLDTYYSAGNNQSSGIAFPVGVPGFHNHPV